MSYEDSYGYIVSIYKVPGPKLDTRVSEMNGKQLLPAEVSQSAVLCAVPAAPYFLPSSGPSKAIPSRSQLFGLQRGVLLKVHRTTTSGEPRAVQVICVNDKITHFAARLPSGSPDPILPYLYFNIVLDPPCLRDNSSR